MSRVRDMLERGLDVWFAPIDPINQRFFETVFATSFLFYLSYMVPYSREWLTEYGFHSTAEMVNTAQFGSPAPLLPEAWLWPVVGGFLAVVIAYILGLGRRWLVWILLIGAVYCQRVDWASAFTINKLFIVGFFFLAISPRPERDEAGKLVVSAWAVRILQATLLIQYMDAGICKIGPGNWLAHPDVLWSQAQGAYRTEVAALFLAYLPMPAWWVMAWASLLFEIFAPALFLWRKSRPWAILYGVAFHLMIAALMKDLIYFSSQMITFYALFLSPALLRAPLGWFKGRKAA